MYVYRNLKKSTLTYSQQITGLLLVMLLERKRLEDE